MSEALSSDTVNLDALSAIGQSEPAMAASDLPTEAITTATAQPELAPEVAPGLAAVAQPSDEVIHVEMAAASAALPGRKLKRSPKPLPQARPRMSPMRSPQPSSRRR